MKTRENLRGSGSGRKVSAGDRLRDVAAHLFYQRGIQAVGVDEIVSESGVTRPTLYRSFASKDGLVAACLQIEAEKYSACLDDIATLYPNDPLSQIRAIVQSLSVELSKLDYRGCALTNTAVEFPDAAHPVRLVVIRSKQRLHDRLTMLSTQLSIDAPRQLADGITLLMEGASMSYHTLGQQGPSTTLVSSAEMLIRSALTRPVKALP